MNERLSKKLEEKKGLYIKQLVDLVALDTRVIGHGIDGGREINGQKFMDTLFRSMGAETVAEDPMSEGIILTAIEKFGEGNPGHAYKDRSNLYARFRGGDGHSLMFNGHIDTMPPGDLALWNGDPHKPEIRNGRLYGLGSCDMKGGLMAAVMAVKLLQDCGIALPGDVLFTSVVDEEGGGNGSIQAALKGQKADGVVVCEPTGGELILAHMGFLFFKVNIIGKANHSGSKWLGVSAIEKAMKLMDALNELEKEWSRNFTHPLLPSPSLNVGVIKGGSAASTVAGNCTFSVCIHYLPQLMSEESVEKVFRERITRCSREDEWLIDHTPEVSKYQAGGGFEMDRGHSFVGSFKKGHLQATGKEAVIAGSPAGCDSRIWRNLASCPTIQFGPGRLEQCHSVNEYLSLESYLQAILIYAHLILDWCGKK